MDNKEKSVTVFVSRDETRSNYLEVLTGVEIGQHDWIRITFHVGGRGNVDLTESTHLFTKAVRMLSILGVDPDVVKSVGTVGSLILNTDALKAFEMWRDATKRLNSQLEHRNTPSSIRAPSRYAESPPIPIPVAGNNTGMIGRVATVEEFESYLFRGSEKKRHDQALLAAVNEESIASWAALVVSMCRKNGAHPDPKDLSQKGITKFHNHIRTITDQRKMTDETAEKIRILVARELNH